MTYKKQLSAASFRAERDQARQELERERRRRKLAESAAVELETVRAENHEAAEWVRDHGGLAHVMHIVNDFRAVVERIGVEWSESELHTIMGVLDSRLMPEGYEWPRYDTGEMVMIGDQIGTPNGGGELCGVEFSSCGMCVLSTEGANGEGQITIDLDNGERVKHPAVLTGDGEPLEVGQTVWNVEYGTEWCVTKVKDGKVFIAFEDFAAEECEPSLLTHQRPVLDADGVPIHEGDTLYGIGRTQHVFVVLGQPGFGGGNGRFKIVCHDVTDGVDCDCDPSLLTHTKPEPPDSWERIEDDATKQPYSYCVERGLDDDALPTNEKFARDLVRRCRALAERGEQE